LGERWRGAAWIPTPIPRGGKGSRWAETPLGSGGRAPAGRRPVDVLVCGCNSAATDRAAVVILGSAGRARRAARGERDCRRPSLLQPGTNEIEGRLGHLQPSTFPLWFRRASPPSRPHCEPPAQEAAGAQTLSSTAPERSPTQRRIRELELVSESIDGLARDPVDSGPNFGMKCRKATRHREAQDPTRCKPGVNQVQMHHDAERDESPESPRSRDSIVFGRGGGWVWPLGITSFAIGFFRGPGQPFLAGKMGSRRPVPPATVSANESFYRPISRSGLFGVVLSANQV
jgi:hypothetical protein